MPLFLLGRRNADEDVVVQVVAVLLRLRCATPDFCRPCFAVDLLWRLGLWLLGRAGWLDALGDLALALGVEDACAENIARARRRLRGGVLPLGATWPRRSLGRGQRGGDLRRCPTPSRMT
jgi:hypothetical protein